MKNFKYCTNNLKNNIYKDYTCKSSPGCPIINLGEQVPNHGPKILTLREFDKEEQIRLSWEHFSNALNCKIVIKA